MAVATTTRVRRGLGRSKARLLKFAVSYILLTFWALLILFPMVRLVSSSLRRPTGLRAASMATPFTNVVPTLAGWQQMLAGLMPPEAWRPFTNTLIIAICSAIVALIVGAMGGYGLSRFEYRLGRLRNSDIAFGFIAQRMLLPVVVVFPLILMFKPLQLLDTKLGMILVYSAFGTPLVLWIMRDYFNALPRDVEESALVDGCSRLACFIRVVVPLALPGLIASFLLVFIYSTNEYLLALMLTMRDTMTMPVFVAGMSRATEWWFTSSLVVLALAPAMGLGLVLERYLVRGLVAGSLKR